jgi:hypothetical protein
MNAERLLREVQKRLVGLPESHRGEILDALREEISRERRRVDPATTVESERERRLEAEVLREVLEAINRHPGLDETISEVLKHLSRLVIFDSCALALADPEGFRIVSVRGFGDPAKAVGSTFPAGLAEPLSENRWTMTVDDLQEDERYGHMEGVTEVRSWAGLPLLVEGQLLGLLSLHRHSLAPFDEDELHRAKALVFSAAAAIRKAQLHDHVRRYAMLMERVVAVNEAVFQQESPEKLAQVILEGALRLGGLSAGLLGLGPTGMMKVAATVGEAFDGCVGRTLPEELCVYEPVQLGPQLVERSGRGLGLKLAGREMSLVPLSSPDETVGVLMLPISGGESGYDTVMEAYASRAATAYLHAVGHD